MQRPLRVSQLPAQFFKRRRVIVVSLNGTQQSRQLLKRPLIQETVVLQAISGPFFDLVKGPVPGHPDNRQIEAFTD